MDSPRQSETIRCLQEKIPVLLLRHRLQLTCWHLSPGWGRKPLLPGKSSVCNSQTSKPQTHLAGARITCSLHPAFYNDWFPVRRNWVWVGKKVWLIRLYQHGPCFWIISPLSQAKLVNKFIFPALWEPVPSFLHPLTMPLGNIFRVSSLCLAWRIKMHEKPSYQRARNLSGKDRPISNFPRWVMVSHSSSVKGREGFLPHKVKARFSEMPCAEAPRL